MLYYGVSVADQHSVIYVEKLDVILKCRTCGSGSGFSRDILIDVFIVTRCRKRQISSERIKNRFVTIASFPMNGIVTKMKNRELKVVTRNNNCLPTYWITSTR